MSVFVVREDTPPGFPTEGEILQSPSTTSSPVAEISTPAPVGNGDLVVLGDLSNRGLLLGPMAVVDAESPPSPTLPTPPTGRRKKGDTLPVELWKHKKVRKQQPSRELMDQLRPVYKPKYYFEDGLRRVVPYNYTYNTFCKERWRGKTLIDIFLEEFRDRPEEYYVCPPTICMASVM